MLAPGELTLPCHVVQNDTVQDVGNESGPYACAQGQEPHVIHCLPATIFPHGVFLPYTQSGVG